MHGKSLSSVTPQMVPKSLRLNACDRRVFTQCGAMAAAAGEKNIREYASDESSFGIKNDIFMAAYALPSIWARIHISSMAISQARLSNAVRSGRPVEATTESRKARLKKPRPWAAVTRSRTMS